MRSVFRKSSALALVILGCSAGAARAETLTVNVPFPFVVHGKTLPAGKYSVRPVEEDRSAFMIRGQQANSGQSAIVMTNPSGGHDPAGDKPALIFTKHENQYRLSTIWESGSDGRTVAGS